MAKYINVDNLHFPNIAVFEMKLHGATVPMVRLVDLQKLSPEEDVQPVVRCKDCKNNYVTTHNHGKQDDPRCDFTDRHLSLDDFCSRGERRMDGGT